MKRLIASYDLRDKSTIEEVFNELKSDIIQYGKIDYYEKDNGAIDEWYCKAEDNRNGETFTFIVYRNITDEEAKYYAENEDDDRYFDVIETNNIIFDYNYFIQMTVDKFEKYVNELIVHSYIL